MDWLKRFFVALFCINKMRRTLKKRCDKAIDLPNRTLTIFEGDKGFAADLRDDGYALGIFPMRRLSKWGEFSLSEIISKPLSFLSDLSGTCVKSIQASVTETFVRLFVERIETSKKAALLRVKKSYNAIHQDFVAGIVKKNRDDFRRDLLQNLGKGAGQVFTGVVEKHLATLLMKLKQELIIARSHGNISMSTGIMALPNGTRFLFTQKDMSVFVVEQVPQVHTINFRGERLFKLAFPFVVFVVTLKGNAFRMLQVFFRKERLGRTTDSLLCPAIPNVRNDFSMCFPAPGQHQNPCDIVEEAIQNFWGSNFNNDLPGFMKSAQSKIPQVHSFDVWQENSRSNPQFAISLNWEPANMTLEEVVNRSMEAGTASESRDPTVESSAGFVQKLGNHVSQDVQEACFFLVPNVSVVDNSLESAQQQLNALIDQSYSGLKQQVDKDLVAIVSDEAILSPIREVIEKTMNEIMEESRKAMNALTERINIH
ncbi:MAG: hypothetical protein WC797_04675 [Candidatus Paceibacterota bacterium]|jgi:hypothetical protein